jgi:hypothetical protein
MPPTTTVPAPPPENDALTDVEACTTAAGLRPTALISRKATTSRRKPFVKVPNVLFMKENSYRKKSKTDDNHPAEIERSETTFRAFHPLLQLDLPSGKKNKKPAP